MFKIIFEGTVNALEVLSYTLGACMSSLSGNIWSLLETFRGPWKTCISRPLVKTLNIGNIDKRFAANCIHNLNWSPAIIVILSWAIWAIYLHRSLSVPNTIQALHRHFAAWLIKDVGGPPGWLWKIMDMLPADNTAEGTEFHSNWLSTFCLFQNV